MALIDAIRVSHTPVHTICFGSGMSMGLMVFLVGHRRFAGKHCTFMYHELSDIYSDKLEGIKKNVAEYERLQSLIDSIITSKTKILQEQLNKYRETKSEWYIPADEALKLSIAHELM